MLPREVITKTYTCILLLLLTIQNTKQWRRRRRSPPPCPPRNCQVGPWTSWSACTHRCGNAGTQSRTRGRTVGEACGGRCPYHMSESQNCNRNACQNGGQPASGYCVCKAGFAGTCCENDVNECLRNPCQHKCTNTYGSYTCQCNPCYTKLGTRCELRQCLIGGRCYAIGAVNPGNQCQDCNSNSKQAWTNNNALRCSDGKACTKADHCSNGRCVGTPFTCLPCERCESDTCKVNPGYCTIVENGKKTCFTKNALRPGYPCQQCDDNNPHQWTINNNLPCSDNKLQTKDDKCVSGVCRGTPYSCLPCERHDGKGCPLTNGHCVIQHNGRRTCFANQNLKPGNPCQWCNAVASKTTWTNRNSVSCDDGNKCTKSDTCTNGQCTGVAFTCNSHCQTCNGRDCSQKTGFGFVNGKCTCRIGGKDYNHQQINPANQCQWCDLYDAASKSSGTWTNRPSVPCNDGKACTHKDMCNNGKCAGQSYSCQSSYPSSSCIRTSVCLGNGNCKDIMRAAGTICRAAKDACDKPEKCNGNQGACPADITDVITIKTGSVQFQNPTFTSSASYQHITNSVYLSITGFTSSCGALKYKWYLLDGSSACTTNSIAKGDLPNTNVKQTISSLSLQDNKSYKIAIQAVDMRGATRPLVCSGVIIIDTTKPQVGWVNDGNTADIDFQATKTISATWGGFNTRNGIGKYEWRVMYTAFGSGVETQLLPFTSNGVNTKASKTFNNIVDGSRIKVVVRAFTKSGLYTDSTSDGVVVDLSKPTAARINDGASSRVDVKYAKWTNTFTANWDAFADPHSGILKYEWAVKRGDSLITAYKPSGLTRSFTATALNLVSGETYCAVVRGYNKAGLYVEAESNCVLIDRDPPQAGTVNDGLSSDVQHQSNGSAISANWNGFNDGAKGSGIVGYQYKIADDKMDIVGWTSVGMKTSITHNGLALKNGVKYYVTVKAVDAVGLSKEVKSNGVIADTTSPVFTGKVIVRGTTDVCSRKPCVYVKTKDTIHVTWSGFSDGHSSLSHYEWAVIPAAQNVKASDFKRVSGSSLTTSASFSGLSLTDGQLYKVIIRAYNRAFLYTDATSDTIIPDSTPPQAGLVSDGATRDNDIDYQSSLSYVKATWTMFKEPHTGIRQYYYAVGSCTQGNYHITNNQFVAATPPLQTAISIENLNLVNGQRYCTKVKATNMAGVYSQDVTSDGFMVDNTPPDVSDARVIDGTTQIDIDYQANLTEMTASWHGIKDPESGIKFFEYGISRNRAGAPDILPFQNNGLKTSARATGLSLTEDVYYFIVCATNNAGLKTCLSSDGVLIDMTEPSKGIVNDGVIEPDIKYQSSLTSIAANWEGIWDLESQIERFEWAVKDTTRSKNVAQSYVDVGLATHVKSEVPLSLVNGRTYKIHLKVINHAGRVTERTSNGVTVDSTAPHPRPILPGIPGNRDWIYNADDQVYYSSSSSQIFAYWSEFIEDESEVWFYKWAIGTTKCGTQIQPLINIGRSTSVNTTMSNLKFIDGLTYYVTVTSRNKANLVARSCSEAFLMDMSSPNVGTVLVGDSDQHHQFVGPEKVDIYWKDFTDRESGIDYCDVSVTSSSGRIFIGKKKGMDSGTVHVPESMLQSGREYRAVVTCVNKANLTTTQTSKPFSIDKTPPVPQGQLNAGISRDGITQYQSDSKSITVTWRPFNDPESPIKEYWLAIGTTHLNDDIVALQNVGLTTQVVSTALGLINGTKYFITVYGVNSAGLNSSLQGLPLIIDGTPPVALDGSVMDGVGSDEWEFFNAKEAVAGHWETISDPESGILKSAFCLGTKPFGCQIKAVTETNETSFTCKDCKIKQGERVFITVVVTNGAGLSVTRASNGMTLDSSPPVISDIIDGDDPTGKDIETALMTWNISFTWHGAEDRQSGISPSKCRWTIVDNDGSELFSYVLAGSYKLGVKQTISAEQPYSFIPFNSSKLYYNVIECINGARLKKNVRSNGFRVVAQWPVAGDVRDGPVINKDLDYLTSTKDVQANWNAFTADARDPVSNYAWAIGSQQGEQDIMKFKDAGLALHDTVTLAPDEPDLDVLIPGKKYFITVKGTSVSGLSSQKSSNGFIVDTTPPVKSDVKVTSTVSDNSKGTVNLYINWSGVRDVESDVKESKYCVGTTPSGCVTDEIAVGTETKAVLSSFKPVSMATYYVTVLTTNKAGLTTTMTSKAFAIDRSPPSRGQVLDGVDQDIDYMNTTNSISVLWAGFVDKDTSVQNCTWTLVEQSASSDGSYFGNDTTIFEQAVQPRGQATRDGLSLKPGSRYISTITCMNRDGFSVSSSSDGVIVDLTPPVSNKVIDGVSFSNVINFTSDTSQVTTTWKAFTDSESGIMGYRWGLGTSPGKDDVVGFSAVGMLRQGKAENISLVPGGPYYVTVEGTNKAGLSTQGWSNGFIVDLSPPMLKLTKVSGPWLGPKDRISASWQSSDLESHIKTTEYCVGTSPGGCQTKSLTSLSGSATNLTCSDCKLSHNVKYYVTIRVWNHAGLYNVTTSDKIKVDFTPPLTGDIVPGNDVISCVSQCTLTFNVTGFEDRESGLDTCRFAIQSSSGFLTSFTKFSPPELISASNLTLVNGQRYFAVVSCVNNAKSERKMTSDVGVLVDVTPPTKGTVIVSPDRTHDVFGIHSNCHLYNTTLRVHWSGFDDPETGITGFKVSLHKENSSYSIGSPRDVGITTSTTIDVDIDQGVYANDILYVTVEAKNAAGLVTSAQSPATRLVSAETSQYLNEGDFFCVNV